MIVITNKTVYDHVHTLCGFSNVFENVMHTHLMFGFRKQLTDVQHGFERRCSVETNWLSFLNYAAPIAFRGTQVDVLYFIM